MSIHRGWIISTVRKEESAKDLIFIEFNKTGETMTSRKNSSTFVF